MWPHVPFTNSRTLLCAHRRLIHNQKNLRQKHLGITNSWEGNNVIQSSELDWPMRKTAAANCVLVAALTAFGQTETSPSFEVASIKPNSSGSGDSDSHGTTGQLTITNRSLKDLIALAYSVPPVLIAGPDWLDSTRFDIVAKVPAGVGKDKRPTMMKALLIERFHLVVHNDSKEMPAYALVLAKSGPKLQQVEPGGTSVSNDGNRKGETITGKGVSMSRLADALARVVEHPVVDQTGLPGVYNVKLEYVPENARPDVPDGPAGLSIYAALQEQLGLKLQTQRLPVAIVVVDHVERVPTEN
jgi:uncharacterized protein (TIGR03435 family)